MTDRRELADMLIDVADAAFVAAGASGVRTTSMELALPVEMAVEMRGGALALIGELPRFVFRTSFDRPPSRLTVVWAEGDDA